MSVSVAREPTRGPTLSSDRTRLTPETGAAPNNIRVRAKRLPHRIISTWVGSGSTRRLESDAGDPRKKKVCWCCDDVPHPVARMRRRRAMNAVRTCCNTAAPSGEPTWIWRNGRHLACHQRAGGGSSWSHETWSSAGTYTLRAVRVQPRVRKGFSTGKKRPQTFSVSLRLPWVERGVPGIERLDSSDAAWMRAVPHQPLPTVQGLCARPVNVAWRIRWAP